MPAMKPSVTGPTAGDDPTGVRRIAQVLDVRREVVQLVGENENRGIGPGPVMTASPTVVGSAWVSAGATNPPPTAPPPPAGPWQAAQLRRTGPAAWTSAAEVTTSGIAGPCPSDAT